MDLVEKYIGRLLVHVISMIGILTLNCKVEDGHYRAREGEYRVTKQKKGRG